MAKKSKKNKIRDVELLKAQFESSEAFSQGQVDEAIQVNFGTNYGP